MKKITNLFLIILITGLSYGQGKANAKYTRWNVNTLEGRANLEAMNIAFEKMRALGCESGISWYYQGAIHSIPNAINGDNKFCAKYQTTKDKLWAWADCTHNGSDSASLNFLLWHRMYIWYLEKIVRELSGKDDFALPYWNYGSTQTADNIMAEPIRNKSGSLYTAARYTILNNGKPILPNQVKDIQSALTELQKNPSFSGSGGFSKTLEIAPHGYMHNLIGGGYADPVSETYYNEIYQIVTSGLMGKVPSAGFDPVFWLHHSMIDRIWESWDVSKYGQRPTLKQLEANPWPYEFIAPNGDRVTYTMKEVFDIVFNLDYKYDTLLYGSKTPVLAANETEKNKIGFQDAKGEIIWEQKVGKVLGGIPFTHKVTSTLAKRTNKVFKSVNSKILLNLDVVVYKEPKDYYTVYLRYPGKQDLYVGAMTFFGVAHDHGMEEDHAIEEKGVKLNFAYYISDNLLDSDKDFEVIIKKSGGGDAKVTLEKISVVKAN